MKAIRLKYLSMAVLLATAVSGCGAFSALDEVVPDNSKKYRKADTMPPLDVPPDLSTSRINDDIVSSQNSTATYSEFEEASNNPLASKYNITPETKPSLSGEGSKRHLIVPGDREMIWSQILDFWAQKNIEVTRKDMRIGIMDTEQAPDGYTYRVRMERGDTSKTALVYISEAAGDNNSQKDEAMLRQLADFLGVLHQEEQAKMEALKQSQPETATVTTQLIDEAGEQKALLVDQDFADVWNRVGRVLDSKGFAVEDRDRSRGTYFVRYLDPLNEAQAEESGLFSKLAFWKDDVEKAPDEFYYIKLISDAAKTKIVILDAEEVRISSETAQRLLTLMQEQLSQ